MIHDPGILAIGKYEIGFFADEGDAPPEIGEVHRQTGIDWVAPAMNKARVGKQKVNETKLLEVEGLLVGDPGGGWIDPAQQREIVGSQRAPCFRAEESCLGDFPRRGSVEPEKQFFAGADLGMARDDLLNQRRARTWHTDDEERRFV